MVEDDFARAPLSPSGETGSADFAAPAFPPNQLQPSAGGPAGDQGRSVGWDPVAVLAAVLVVLTLAVPAAVLGGWAVARSAGDSVRSRRAWIITGIALAEVVVGALLWTVYFVWLAPVLALPAR